MKRLGKFYVSPEMIRNPALVEILKRLAFLPYRVEFLAHKDSFEYIGISKAFEELEAGSLPPEYEIVTKTEMNKFTKRNEIVSVTAHRC